MLFRSSSGRTPGRPSTCGPIRSRTSRGCLSASFALSGRGFNATYSDPLATVGVAKQEFPTIALEDLTAAVKRCLADQLWSKDGFIEPAAWTMAQNVVRSAGLLKQEVPYEDVIDMQFVKR